MPTHRTRTLVAAGLATVLLTAGGEAPARAQDAVAPRPFALPFAMPPGPSTWLMGQAYGNTAGAYRQRKTTYRLAGGIHFGLDLTAPCGTELVAMADGIVAQVDNMNNGSAPHNLLVDHPQIGKATFFGHLLERPALSPGQAVTRGQALAKVGDPGLTCSSRPHLHLEVRDLRHTTQFNPVTWVEADWDGLALVGPFGNAFQRDLDDPRRWQSLDDQPESVIGGALLNDFARPWPPEVR